jgi:hypothetical protein
MSDALQPTQEAEGVGGATQSLQNEGSAIG